MAAFTFTCTLPPSNNLIVDMRSDTVTRPTEKMRQAMAQAEVGDDVMRDDPTINSLEDRVAMLFGKEAALWFPTGTQSNLAALLSWVPSRGSEFICGDQSHMFLFEQAGAAQFGGVSWRTVPNLENGAMDLQKVADAVRDDDIHEPITKLICVENTHNACGGRVVPLQFFVDLKTLATAHSLPVHLDGARLWNAISALGITPKQAVESVDSASVCLSKGLGAPAGSLLIGPRVLIEKARRVRKALGGGMRQVGILAAAGHVALDDFEAGMLARDHERAQRLAEAIRPLKSFTLSPSVVDSNIIFADITLVDSAWEAAGVDAPRPSSRLSAMMKERGVLVSAWAPRKIRLVVHRDVNDEGIDRVIAALTEVSSLIQSSQA